jgi:MFS family permease
MTTTAQRVTLLKRAWRNRSLRRLCLAVAGFRFAEIGVWIALTAYAYSAGGVGEASAVMVAQLVPAMFFAFAVGGLIRRHGAGRVLRWGLAVQSLGMLFAAAFLREGVNVVAFAGAIVVAAAVTTTRPAQSVLTPTLVDGPDELTAANVLTGLLMGASGLAGPAVAAILMTWVGSWAVLAVMAVVVAVATVAVWRLPAAQVASAEDPESVLTGIRATARERGPRVMVLAISAYYVVIGAYDVVSVVIAVEILGRSEAFTGFLTTAAGVGSVIAGAAALAVIGRRWISPWILVSGVATGVTLVLVSVVGAHVAVSMLVLVGFGAATAMYELTALMLLQRVTRLDLLGHVFALVEALQMAMLALGAAIVPLAVKLFGSEWAPGSLGVLFMALLALVATRIVHIDRHARVPITEMATLRATPLFGALPGPALETVAREARRVEVAAGRDVVVQGESGREYYAVISGHLVVSIDGAIRAELGRGDAFGEIALLRDVPRMATVRATDETVLLAVDREPFLTAVTGHAVTRATASSITARHLDPE